MDNHTLLAEIFESAITGQTRFLSHSSMDTERIRRRLSAMFGIPLEKVTFPFELFGGVKVVEQWGYSIECDPMRLNQKELDIMHSARAVAYATNLNLISRLNAMAEKGEIPHRGLFYFGLGDQRPQRMFLEADGLMPLANPCFEAWKFYDLARSFADHAQACRSETLSRLAYGQGLKLGGRVTLKKAGQIFNRLVREFHDGLAEWTLPLPTDLDLYLGEVQEVAVWFAGLNPLQKLIVIRTIERKENKVIRTVTQDSRDWAFSDTSTFKVTKRRYMGLGVHVVALKDLQFDLNQQPEFIHQPVPDGVEAVASERGFTVELKRFRILEREQIAYQISDATGLRLSGIVEIDGFVIILENLLRTDHYDRGSYRYW